MSDDNARREFMKWLGLGAGAAAVGGFASGCPGPGGSENRDAGPRSDAPGTGETDTGGAGDATADTAPGDTTDAAPPSDSEGDPDGGDASCEPEDAGSGADDDGECRETGDDVEGPFHEEGAPQRKKLAPDDEPGQRIIIRGTVYEPDCQTPVPGAMLDVWHANEQGDYYDASDNYRLRGQVQTGDDGTYELRTIKPGRYEQAGGPRPAHVHFIVTSPQFGALTTQMYFEGDPFLGSEDSCGICGSDDPTLIVDFRTQCREGSEVLVGTFDIVLSA